jgi:putative hydrolase of HD superfamily
MHKELAFLNIAQNLKMELRHSWLSDNRQESVAEHSWRLALMAMRYADKLDQPVDIALCLKYAIIHDLAEATAGDIPVFNCQTVAEREAKFCAEQQAMLAIKALLDDEQGDELYALWLAYEQQQDYEGKFIKALDKLEVHIQHNEALMASWEAREKRMVFQKKWLEHYCRFDSFLYSLYQMVHQQALDKLRAAGEDLAQLKAAAYLEQAEWE